MITWSKAPRVAPGQRVTSSQWNALAGCESARLRSGLGSGTYRLRQYLYAFFRAIRLGDGDLLPSEYEFLSFYGAINPADAAWPEAEAGDAEGIDPNSPPGAFVFGSETIDVVSESARVSDPGSGGVPFSLSGGPVPTTPGEIWRLGKYQRGIVAPVQNKAAAVAIDAGRSAYQIYYSLRDAWGNSYGGYIASPEIGVACEDPDPGSGNPPPVDWLFRFTSLKPGILPDKVYDGACVPAPGNAYPTHVASIGYTPWAYFVQLNNGTLDILLAQDYIEGPYTGQPALRRAHGGAHWADHPLVHAGVSWERGADGRAWLSCAGIVQV